MRLLETVTLKGRKHGHDGGVWICEEDERLSRLGPYAKERICGWGNAFKEANLFASENKTARLLSTLKVNPDVDVYVLCVVDGSTLDFKGWAFKEELILEENKTDLGYGVGYALTQDKLRRFE